MFQLDWAQKDTWATQRALSPAPTTVDRNSIRNVSLLFWEEHCHECAPPDCYASCPIYIARADKKCSRFVYGIYPNAGYNGVFDFGADVRFRRWGKLETKLYGKSLSMNQQSVVAYLDRRVTSFTNQLSKMIQFLSPKRRLNGALTLLRSKALNCLPSPDLASEFDEFVLECFSPDAQAFRLILEYKEDQPVFRRSFQIFPGLNRYSVPVADFNFDSSSPKGRMLIFPENDAEKRLIFTWLHFVKYKVKAGPSQPSETLSRQRPTVKCVAWDLDNTLWDGIVSEDGVEGVHLRPAAVALIKHLDESGILQTIVSKNNHHEAQSALQHFNLESYFLHPAINWQPKSQNLAHISQKLNLGLDSFALIDDSPFERSEVSSALPEVRVYSDADIESLAGFDDFRVPITETSKARRSLYLTEIQRQKQKEAYSGDYETFLRSCEIKLSIFVPREDKHILRCLELIQRANQLNISNRRHSEAELKKLLSTEGVLSVALECRDKFGNYGLVGFASIDEREEGRPIVRDFVLSCRVAQKRIEHTFLAWCAQRQADRGETMLLADVVRTGRNGPLLQVFDDLHFRSLSEDGGHLLVALPLAPILSGDDIVHVSSELEGLCERR